MMFPQQPPPHAAAAHAPQPPSSSYPQASMVPQWPPLPSLPPPQLPFNQTLCMGFPVAAMQQPLVFPAYPAAAAPPPPPACLQPAVNVGPFVTLHYNPSLPPPLASAVPLPVSNQIMPSFAAGVSSDTHGFAGFNNGCNLPTAGIMQGSFNPSFNQVAQNPSSGTYVQHRVQAVRPMPLPPQSVRSHLQSLSPGQSESSSNMGMLPHSAPLNVPTRPVLPAASQNFLQPPRQGLHAANQTFLQPARLGLPAADQNFSQQRSGNSQEQLKGIHNVTSGTAQYCDSNGVATGVPVMGIPVHREGAYSEGVSTILCQQPVQQLQHGSQECVARPVGMLRPQYHQSKDVIVNHEHGNHLRSFPTEKQILERGFPAVHGELTPYREKNFEGDKWQHGSWKEHSRCPKGVSENSGQQDVFLNTDQDYSQQQQSSHLYNIEKVNVGSVDPSQQQLHPSSDNCNGGSLHRSLPGHFTNDGTERKYSNNYDESGRHLGRGRKRHFGVDMQGRLKLVSLRCDPCDQTFTNAAQMESHISSHVKCDEEGCSYEARSKLVKEHRVTEHGKIRAASTMIRDVSWQSQESQEEIRRWREERKKNYPTRGNIQRKKEEMEDRKARGEVVDVDAYKRRQCLREVLARQAELGLPVAEIPAKYISDGYNVHRRQCSDKMHKNIAGRDASISEGEVMEITKKPRICHDYADNEILADSAAEPFLKVMQPSKTLTQEVELNKGRRTFQDRNSRRHTHQNLCRFFQKGYCKKGSRCDFVHEHRGRNWLMDSNSADDTLLNKRAPSLLSKLLETEICRDKSHLLQCFRFIVNNSFFIEWPNRPLKYFDWVESGIVTDANKGADIAHGSLPRTDELADDQQHLMTSMGEYKEEKLNQAVASESNSIGEDGSGKDVDGDTHLNLNWTEAPDVWKELQQRLMEDAVGRSALMKGIGFSASHV